MSIEINRFIRKLNELAEANSGVDLFVKVYDESGDLVSPDLNHVEMDNDYKDRIIVIRCRVRLLYSSHAMSVKSCRSRTTVWHLLDLINFFISRQVTWRDIDDRWCDMDS